MPAYQPCLIIVFNHKFDRNIDALEKLYSPHFTYIFFLVPFYTGTNPRVIPVYESSLYFQGYFAQGYKTFYRPEFTHYLFVGDDLILNPAVNEHNYMELLQLDERTSYLPDLAPLHQSSQSMSVSAASRLSTEQLAEIHKENSSENYWVHTFRGITFHENRSGSNAKTELPSREDALKQFASYGLPIRPLTYYNIFGPLTFPDSIDAAIKTSTNLWTYYVTWRRFKIPGHPQHLQLEYPLAYSYSDVSVISAHVIQQFCHLCGVFSAMGLFVEMAVPTALILTGGRVVTDADVKLKGQAIWEWTGDITALEQKYNLDLDALLADFPPEQLYYHPIKLSRWRRSNTPAG